MKKSAVATMIIVLLGAGMFRAGAQMTDDQVVEYVKSATASGKSDTEISRELLARGVTMAQVTRLKAIYSARTDAGASAGLTTVSTVNPRQERPVATDSLRLGYEARPVALDERSDAASGIFGHDIFANRVGVSFEPNENVATPEDYKLGPADEVIIEIWGDNEASIRQTISPEGRINISQIGPVYLNGLTIKEAQAKIKRALASKYSGIGGNSDVSVTLGAIRTIQVNVMGDVVAPGAYRLSSFSTVFSALYRAGGVTDTGSLRAIEVVRNGRKVAAVDIYEYIFSGKSDSDIRLQEGDVIIVPPYVKLVSVSGGVKRPMKYEMAANETVGDLLEYAGGFTGNAYRDNVRVSRSTGRERRIITAGESNLGNVVLEDGDVVTVDANPQRFSNRIGVIGYVVNPGEYELGAGISTLKQLVDAAGGLKEDAFLGRAVLQREKADMTNETKSVNIGAIMKGTAADIRLRKGDVLIVSGIYEINDRGTMTINGMVANPGVFEFAENTTIEDLIVLAGGLLDGASLSKVDVSRRVMDPYGLEETSAIGESFTFSIKDGLAVDGADSFYLEPYDVVSVRKSPSYQPQQFVTVDGEVQFPGKYVLESTGERLSSVIARAGGLTQLAFLKGGKLTRHMTDEEIEVARLTMEGERRNLQKQKQRAISMGAETESLDAAELNLFEVPTRYAIAVDFEKAMSQPGSSYDVILREGDVLNIPENVGTVSIKGEVLFPNTVMYVPGKSLSYYVSQAGGYNNDAKRSKAYVVYMNGSVDKAADARIEPGCEIVVPAKPARRPLSASEVMSIGTSTVSLSTMVITLINIIRK